MKIRNKQEYIFIFFYCWSVLLSLAFLYLVSTPLEHNPDGRSYMHMAQWQNDENPVRRYRIIIPYLAGAVDKIFGSLFDVVHPWSYEGDFSLAMSFLLINVALMALAFTAIYILLRKQDVSLVAAIISISIGLSCRWSVEISGAPLVDSLYFFCVVLFYYGIRSESLIPLIITCYVGFWAKEAFILFLPMLWFVRLLWVKWIPHLSLGILIYFVFRYAFDYWHDYNSAISINENFSHIQSIWPSLLKLFSLHGMYEIFSVVGFWILIPIYLIYKNQNTVAQAACKPYLLNIIFLCIVLLHALLSQDLGRMLFLIMPVYIFFISFSLKQVINDITKVEIH